MSALYMYYQGDCNQVYIDFVNISILDCNNLDFLTLQRCSEESVSESFLAQPGRRSCCGTSRGRHRGHLRRPRRRRRLRHAAHCWLVVGRRRSLLRLRQRRLLLLDGDRHCRKLLLRLLLFLDGDRHWRKLLLLLVCLDLY